MDRLIRFGPFEADTLTQELRKHGVRLRLAGQSFQVLKMLLERPGDLVSREELQGRLWPGDTFVDFERGINAAVNRVRDVLGDSAESPQFIETLPRRGYRFIGEIAPSMPLPSPSQSPGHVEGPTRSDRAFPLQPKVSDIPQQASKPSTVKLLPSIVMATLLCILILAAWYLRPSRRDSKPTFSPVPFTAFPGVETYPTFSPDGAQIAFAWDGGSKASKGFDLYTKVVGSEKILRLTERPSEFVHPAWSPDGSQIAFLRGGVDAGLYVVSALGGPEKKLTPVRMPYETFSGIAWSHDGETIVYPVASADNGDVRLNVLHLKSSDHTPIPQEPDCSHEGYPAFSPDGTQLAYVCVRDYGKFCLYRADAEGHHGKLVTTFSGWPFGVAWTHDATAILFAQDRGGGSEMFEVHLSDGTTEQLPLGEGVAWPALSPGGDNLAFAQGSETVNIWRKDLSRPRSSPLSLISSTREQTNAQYSPDGKHIAFESIRNGNREIWISDGDGTNLVQASHFNCPSTGTPHWSPDSTRIAFDSRCNGAAEVYILELADLQPHKLVTTVAEPSEPSWSRDGRWLYFLSGAADGQRLYRTPAKGGDAVRLSTSKVFQPLEGPDGRTAIFADDLDAPTLKQVSVDEPGREFSVPSIPKVRDADLWTVDSQGIYFVPADAPLSINFFDFATKKIRNVAKVDRPFRSYIGGLSVSSDRHWLIYAQTDEVSGDILLVSHFH